MKDWISTLQFDQNIQKKIWIFTMARLSLICAVLFITVFLKQEVLGEFTIIQIYIALGITFSISLINSIYWEETLGVRYFIPSQLLYDLLLTSYLVFLTGVNDSVFLFLYLLNIVFSSVVYQLHGALIVAGLSGFIYALIYYVNVDLSRIESAYNLAWSELLFLLTALLCGQLMDELKKQRKLLESQRENIARLELLNDRLLNSLPIGLLVIDQNEYVENINKTALQFLKLKNVPEFRLKFYELIPAIKNFVQQWSTISLKQKLRLNFKVNEKSKARYSIQIVDLDESKDGQEQIKTEQDQNNRKMIVLQDVTQILELEQKLKFESKLAATGQLAAGIAHEIRNPLASISGSIELLSKQLEIKDEQNKKLFEISLREISRLNKLITEFLEFAKPRKNNITSFLLKEAILEIAEIFIKQNDIRAIFQINISDSMRVNADRDRIKQVFYNLFNNAVEANIQNQINIQVTANYDNDQINIIISDDGIGVANTLSNKIFDPFFTTKSQGTGLGLSTVAQILKEAKGSIELLPQIKGASFLIHLPIELTDQAD